MNIHAIQTKAAPLFQKYNVRKAALFGSTARQDNTTDSDVDILVEMPKSSNLFDFFALQTELEETLARRVDLVKYDAVKPRLKPYILPDQKILYPL